MKKPNSLFFQLDEGTILDPTYLRVMPKHRGMMDKAKIVDLSEDHKLFIQGNSAGFQIYFLVTHPCVHIVPESVYRIDDKFFSANLRIELTTGLSTPHDVVFRSPILPFQTVSAASHGNFPDAFNFIASGSINNSYICDLTFLTHYAQNPPVIPLQVEYIGIAKAEGRDAYDRLGKGHQDLQDLLAEQNRRPGQRAVSVILYRPNLQLKAEEGVIGDNYSRREIIEIIEATLIQHFKPTPRNERCINFPSDSPALSNNLASRGIKSIETLLQAPQNTCLFSKAVGAMGEHKINVSL